MDFIPNFEDVLLGRRGERRESVGRSEREKSCLLKVTTTFLFLVKVFKNDRRRGEKGTKENIQVFDFFLPAPSCNDEITFIFP